MLVFYFIGGLRALMSHVDKALLLAFNKGIGGRQNRKAQVLQLIKCPSQPLGVLPVSPAEHHGGSTGRHSTGNRQNFLRWLVDEPSLPGNLRKQKDLI